MYLQSPEETNEFSAFWKRPMRRIGVATNFSDRGTVAVRRAAAIAEATGADLLLIYAVDDDRTRPMAATTEQAGAQLRRAAEEYGGRSHCVDAVVQGQVHVALLNAVEQAGAELLVVGDHQRAPILDLFQDTTVERLARFSRVPLLVARVSPTEPYRRAMLGLGSDEAHELIAAVDLLGPAAPGHLTGYHAFDAATKLLKYAKTPEREIDTYRGSIEHGARSFILASLDPALHSRVHLRIEEGDPETGLLRAAAEDRCELTVVSTHARRRLSRIMLGSVSSELIRWGTTDLLVVPRARK